MGSHGVTCHPAEVTFPPLPQPIKAGTRFSDPRGKQGWVDLVGLVTYRGGILARRQSPIPALTRLNVEQLCSCNERRYHSAKPPTVQEYGRTFLNWCCQWYLACICVCVTVASESSLWLRSAGCWRNGGAGDGVADRASTAALHCDRRLDRPVSHVHWWWCLHWPLINLHCLSCFTCCTAAASFLSELDVSFMWIWPSDCQIPVVRWIDSPQFNLLSFCHFWVSSCGSLVEPMDSSYCYL